MVRTMQTFFGVGYGLPSSKGITLNAEWKFWLTLSTFLWHHFQVTSPVRDSIKKCLSHCCAQLEWIMEPSPPRAIGIDQIFNNILCSACQVHFDSWFEYSDLFKLPICQVGEYSSNLCLKPKFSPWTFTFIDTFKLQLMTSTTHWWYLYSLLTLHD